MKYKFETMQTFLTQNFFDVSRNPEIDERKTNSYEMVTTFLLQ